MGAPYSCEEIKSHTANLANQSKNPYGVDRVETCEHKMNLFFLFFSF